MEHYAPHPGAKFEGYYSKFDLSDGSHIALIICSIPNAPTRPHMLSFTYYPPSGTPIFQREHFVPSIESITTDTSTNAFEIRVPGIGSMRTAATGPTTYALSTPDWSFEATTTSPHTPWQPNKSTPEGCLVHLPLPLHWHVHSLCSHCTYTLRIPSLATAGRATVHQEKNWASSFPAAHMWLQAWDARRATGVCLAGGRILCQTAYMLSYRSPTLNLSFAPPFSISYFNILSPFMSVETNWPRRTLTLSLSKYFYKLHLTASAPSDTGWFSLAGPFADGHRREACWESFLASVSVVVWEREGWWPWCGWREVARERWVGGSLEFAGGYVREKGE